MEVIDYIKSDLRYTPKCFKNLLIWLSQFLLLRKKWCRFSHQIAFCTKNLFGLIWWDDHLFVFSLHFIWLSSWLCILEVQFVWCSTTSYLTNKLFYLCFWGWRALEKQSRGPCLICRSGRYFCCHCLLYHVRSVYGWVRSWAIFLSIKKKKKWWTDHSSVRCLMPAKPIKLLQVFHSDQSSLFLVFHDADYLVMSLFYLLNFTRLGLMLAE